MLEKITRSNAAILKENKYVSGNNENLLICIQISHHYYYKINTKFFSLIGVSETIACDMIRKSSDDIKKNLKLTPSFIQSLIDREVIKESHKDILNGSFDFTDDLRMGLLISFVCGAIKDDGENFLFFLEAIREQNSRKADKVADDLKECHDDNYKYEFPNEFSSGQYLYDYVNA